MKLFPHPKEVIATSILTFFFLLFSSFVVTTFPLSIQGQSVANIAPHVISDNLLWNTDWGNPPTFTPYPFMHTPRCAVCAEPMERVKTHTQRRYFVEAYLQAIAESMFNMQREYERPPDWQTRFTELQKAQASTVQKLADIQTLIDRAINDEQSCMCPIDYVSLPSIAPHYET